MDAPVHEPTPTSNAQPHIKHLVDELRISGDAAITAATVAESAGCVTAAVAESAGCVTGTGASAKCVATVATGAAAATGADSVAAAI